MVSRQDDERLERWEARHDLMLEERAEWLEDMRYDAPDLADWWEGDRP